MKIVVTNDDGIDAPGIAALERAARAFGPTVVVAPSSQQSNVGHQVTTLSPIAVTELAPDRFSVSGTPADCARLAVSCLADDAEWLLSGINRGGNLGVDVYLSGTVAAAREAALLGWKAVAISHYVARGKPMDWARAEAMAARALEVLLVRPLPAACFWNVNLPHLASEDSDPPIVDCPLDFSPLHVRYRREGDLYHYAGDYHSRGRCPGTDVDVCFRGKIAVSAIPLALAGSEAR